MNALSLPTRTFDLIYKADVVTFIWCCVFSILKVKKKICLMLTHFIHHTSSSSNTRELCFLKGELLTYRKPLKSFRPFHVVALLIHFFELNSTNYTVPHKQSLLSTRAKLHINKLRFVNYPWYFWYKWTMNLFIFFTFDCFISEKQTKESIMRPDHTTKTH